MPENLEGNGPPQRELRIAVVMTGGVSLCIWMGGTARELDSLRRKSGIYGEILGALGAEPVVDIIGGTSAGGLNGTLLGAAMAWDTDLSNLGSVWLELADFQSLLRSPSQRNPPSLLKGDDFFLPQIRAVLDEMQAKSPPDSATTRTLHLIVTTTLMDPVMRNYVDENDVEFSEPTYQGLFHFLQTPDPGRDDFKGTNGAQALALAARSSASFPGAFEASYVAVGPGGGTFHNMGSIPDFDVNRYVIDGGVVDNDPLDVVLDAIAAQPAAGLVHRNILFVNPLGTKGPAPKTVDRTTVPSIFKVLEHTLLIPRQHSNALLYDELGLRAGQAKKLQGLRTQLFEGIDDVSSDRDAAVALRDTASRIEPLVLALRKVIRSKHGDTSDAQAQRQRQNLLIVQDLLRRALIVCGPGPQSALMESRVSISAALRVPIPSEGPARPAVVTPAGEDGPIPGAMKTLVGLFGTDQTPPLVRLTYAWKQLQREVIGIAALAFATPSAGTVATGGDAAWLAATNDATWSQALQDLDMLQSIVTDGDVHNPQQIDFFELSAYSPATPGKTPQQKLTGVQLGHFGAFYATSWRQNDWMWGRLDGSYRLIEMLVDPEYLVEVADPGVMAEKLNKIVGSIAPSDYRDNIEKGLKELISNPPGPERTAIANALRVTIATPLWQKERAQILSEELPRLLSSASADLQSGLVPSDAMTKFLTKGATLPNRPSATQLGEVWDICPIGTEKISQQFGSDRFAQLATQAGAVAVETIGAGVKWTPAKAAARVLSWPLRVANFLVSPANTSRASGMGVVLVAMLASFALAITVAGEYQRWVMIVGIVVWAGVFLADVSLKQYRLALGSLVVLGLGLGAVALGRNGKHVVEELLGTFIVALAALLTARTGKRTGHGLRLLVPDLPPTTNWPVSPDGSTGGANGNGVAAKRRYSLRSRR